MADEVRNLAAQSSAAAKDTGELIKDSIDKAEFGVQIADETSVSLNGIIEGINESGKIVNDIAEFSEEQRVAITHINIGIEQVAQVVQKNGKSAEESALSSEVMSRQSNILQDAISKFTFKKL